MTGYRIYHGASVCSLRSIQVCLGQVSGSKISFDAKTFHFKNLDQQLLTHNTLSLDVK